VGVSCAAIGLETQVGKLAEVVQALGEGRLVVKLSDIVENVDNARRNAAASAKKAESPVSGEDGPQPTLPR